MAFIGAAFLVAGASEVEAFYGMAVLMLGRPRLARLFDPGFGPLQRFSAAFDVLLKRRLPAIHAHLARHSVTLDMILPRWLLSGFFSG